MDQNKKVYTPPAITPSTADQQSASDEWAKQDIGQRSSHVTISYSERSGHDFNPRIRKELANEPDVVHTSRDLHAEKFVLSDKVNARHEASAREYPHLNMSAGEYLILDVSRHPIGMLAPIAVGGFLSLILLVVLIIYPVEASQYNLPSFGLAALIIGLVIALIGIGTCIAIWVYRQNRFYLTNESVIQVIQTSLFSRREQMVSLGSIEDASFHQHGIIQMMFNYGMVRLSTEGDETTYRFAYASEPRSQVTVLNNAIEAFKNGRPFDPSDDVN